MTRGYEPARKGLPAHVEQHTFFGIFCDYSVAADLGHSHSTVNE
jgi:hypothetical protein